MKKKHLKKKLAKLESQIDKLERQADDRLLVRLEHLQDRRK